MIEDKVYIKNLENIIDEQDKEIERLNNIINELNDKYGRLTGYIDKLWLDSNGIVKNLKEYIQLLENKYKDSDK